MSYRVKLLSLLSFVITSCATPTGWLTTRVPKQIRYLESDLAVNLGRTTPIYPNTQFYLMWPLITKSNAIGIYLYSRIGPHIRITHAFMYDGNTVFYTDITDSIGMKSFIESNQFSKRKIKKFDKKLELFKKDNESENELW